MTEVKFLDETFQYVPQKGVSGWVRRDIIAGHTQVDGERDREMAYQRFSFRATQDEDEYEDLYHIPFGVASITTVSGT